VTVKQLLPAEPCIRAECYPRHVLSNKITAYIHEV